MNSYRISPPRVFPEATHAGKPPPGSAGSADSYRQTTFVLGAETELILDGLRTEGAIAEASSAAKYRNQRLVAFLATWSRGWLARLEALHAVEWGNYAAAMGLIRAAADCQAAALALLRDPAEWEEWLAGDAIALAPAQHATAFRLHAFRSAETMAGHETIGPVYRMATDFSLPHFGATLLIAGNESDPTKVSITFGDRDFHLGLGELALGWIALLGAAQIEDALTNQGVLAAPDPAAAAAIATGLRNIASRAERCSASVVEVDGVQRYLVQNWRRAPGGAPKRVLL